MAFSISLLSILLTVASQTPAQPDFSGRWVLIASDPTPADVPTLLVVQQHVQTTGIRGNPIGPGWDLLIVEGDDSKSGIRSGNYRFGIGGGVGGSPVTRDSSGALPPRPMTKESVTWEGGRLNIVSEEWMERQDGRRESYKQHREVWALTGQGRLVITASDSNAESRTLTVTYQKEPPRR